MLARPISRLLVGSLPFSLARLASSFLQLQLRLVSSAYVSKAVSLLRISVRNYLGRTLRWLAADCHRSQSGTKVRMNRNHRRPAGSELERKLL